MLYFENDYCEGAHPAILQKLVETNFEKVSGYGTDPYCASAREKIARRAAHRMPMSGSFRAAPRATPSSLHRCCAAGRECWPHPPAMWPLTRPVPSSSRATRSSACRTPMASWMPGLLRTGAGPSMPMAMWTTSCSRAWCTSPTRRSTAPCTPRQSWKRFPLSAISTTCRCLWTVPVWAMAWPPRAPM